MQEASTSGAAAIAMNLAQRQTPPEQASLPRSRNAAEAFDGPRACTLSAVGFPPPQPGLGSRVEHLLCHRSGPAGEVLAEALQLPAVRAAPILHLCTSIA